ncbi:MSMEG_4193 family putative phosphomutase [Streptomyces sp. ACA25]|uniref:histidine phosphatase family protein n=1 Tax=Streptomyces sp. ACA25 TaxID=3022596 RepID=UPI0023078B5B|nr:histidine phosphatase family protein [Streptomyces sp. ACA25]MDB1089039.1 MSMEG_4193 family putative phosphomutase [Streptomyces sp. ACA25]
MPTLLLVRHGRTAANSAGVLAGRTPGVGLDELGAEQAAALPGRLSGVPLVAAAHSPLQRCRETLEPLRAARPELPVRAEDRIVECDYGEWTGRKLAELAEEPLMSTVQRQPSAAVFPGGESLRAMQHRAVDAAREWAGRIERDHGPDALWLMCTHGDIIKSLVADALGLHLDLFQRIAAGPASVTAIRYTTDRPFLLRLGDTGELGGLAPDLAGAVTPERGDAAVGGGA